MDGYRLSSMDPEDIRSVPESTLSLMDTFNEACAVDGEFHARLRPLLIPSLAP